MSDTSFLDRYVDAWLGHVAVNGPEGEARLQALLALMSEEIEYVDVPTGRVSVGHEGVRRMATGVSTRFDEIRLAALSAVGDGARFAIEYETVIRFDADRELVVRGVATGVIASDGKVASHRDYYDRSGF